MFTAHQTPAGFKATQEEERYAHCATRLSGHVLVALIATDEALKLLLPSRLRGACTATEILPLALTVWYQLCHAHAARDVETQLSLKVRERTECTLVGEGRTIRRSTSSPADRPGANRYSITSPVGRSCSSSATLLATAQNSQVHVLETEQVRGAQVMRDLVYPLLSLLCTENAPVHLEQNTASPWCMLG